MTGSIGMMVYIFAICLPALVDGGKRSVFLCRRRRAGVDALNLLGLMVGKGAQNLLTLAKVLGIGAILFAGLRYGDPAHLTEWKSTTSHEPDYRLALILILYTYGGWNDAAYVAAEQRNHRRNIPLALILGTLLITVIYLLINVAYLLVLGFNGAAGAREIAADVLARLAGIQGERLCVLVLISSPRRQRPDSNGFASIRRSAAIIASSLFLSQWHPRGGAAPFALRPVRRYVVDGFRRARRRDTISSTRCSLVGRENPDWSGRDFRRFWTALPRRSGSFFCCRPYRCSCFVGRSLRSSDRFACRDIR